MEFPKNIAEQLDGDSVGAVRAWRHQMICKLIDAGVTDHEHLKDTVSALYDFVVSPHKKDNTEAECAPKEAVSKDFFANLATSKNLLNTVINQADLPNSQLECINLFVHTSSQVLAHLQALENLKKELESPDLQQETRDALKRVIDCLSDTQTWVSP